MKKLLLVFTVFALLIGSVASVMFAESEVVLAGNIVMNESTSVHKSDNTLKFVNFVDFHSAVGDYFMVDIDAGFGYIMNDDLGRFTAFPVMTGARGTPTPEEHWVILSKHVKGNHFTFGRTGEFLRMYRVKDGEKPKRTAYGIHNYALFDEKVADDTKFLSLGCVLVSEDVLNIVEESWLVNGRAMDIYTKHGVYLSPFVYLHDDLSVSFDSKRFFVEDSAKMCVEMGDRFEITDLF